MWYDADVDAVMTRTSRRPVPMGRVQPGEALAFGLTLAGFSVAIARPAGELARRRPACIHDLLLCRRLYGMAKALHAAEHRDRRRRRRLSADDRLGGNNGSLSLEPVLLFLIIFFWTPPHFWALALYRTDDYARAGIPMLPVVSGDASTRRQILLYMLILVPLGIAPWLLGYTGAIYGVTAVISGAIMLMLGWQVLRERPPAERASRNLFAFSILYLFLLFAVLLVDRGWGGLIARLAT